MNMLDQDRWLDVCALEDIPVLGSRVIRREGRDDVAVFRGSQGQLFALLDKCPHKGGPLSQGIVFGDRVACPLHNWSIQLADGNAVAPDQGCTKSYTVRLVAERVYLDRIELMS